MMPVMERVKVYLRVGVLFVSALATLVASHYVDQQRYQHIGFCPPNVAGSPSLLVFDTRNPTAYCIPLPAPNAGLIDPSKKAPA